MEEYRNLRAKVDAQFEKLFRKHQKQISCKKGCHDCCAPELSVTQVEADMIKNYLKENKELSDQLSQLAKEDPYKGTRCSFLRADGLCGIYEVRPLVCRSHGVPVLVQIDEKREGIDACPKNFENGMNMIDVGDWIHLETLNTMTALIDWRYALDQGREKPDPERDRIALHIESILDLNDET